MTRLIAGINITLYILLQIFGSIAAGIVFLLTNSLNAAIFTMVTLTFVLMVIYVVLNFKYLKSQLKDYNSKFMIFSILGYILYIVITILFSALLYAFGYQAPESANQESINQLFLNSNLVLMFIMVAVQAPFVEEIVFRSAIVSLFTGRDTFAKKWLFVLGVLASLAVFVLLHVTTEVIGGAKMIDVIAVTFPYFVITCIMIGLFIYFRANVFASMTLHYINNITAGLLMILFVILGGIYG